MELIGIKEGDVLEMKKIHPCGEKRFTVLFAGSDVRLRCNGCGKELSLPRTKLEKSVKNVVFIK